MTTRIIKAEDTKHLRHLVLWPHIEKTEDCVIDIDQREDAIHIGTFDKEELISCCSLFELYTDKLSYNTQYRLRAMATHPDHRGKGAGRVLVEFAKEIIRNKDFEVLWCDAREVALGFYANLGFDVIDEWYDVPKIGPHKLMYFPFK